MKKIFAVCLFFLVVYMAVAAIPVSAADKEDKCGDWIGNYNGLSYRYCYAYLGNNTWSQTINLVQFWNTNSFQVKLRYYMVSGNKTYGPRVLYIDPSDKYHPGPKVAIADGERISSIKVEASR